MLRPRVVPQKRGQNLSITVLVIAALAITVFVILSFIFFRGSADTVDTLNSCEKRGGQCIVGTSCGTETTLSGTCTKLAGQDRICCTKLFGNNT